jgi:hypothetical protein
MLIVLGNELFRYGYVQGKDKVQDRCDYGCSHDLGMSKQLIPQRKQSLIEL